MQQRQYRIPNEVTTELKINKMLYLYDLLFLVALIIVRLIALPFIPDVLHLPFTCFLVGVRTLSRHPTDDESGKADGPRALLRTDQEERHLYRVGRPE